MTLPDLPDMAGEGALLMLYVLASRSVEVAAGLLSGLCAAGGGGIGSGGCWHAAKDLMGGNCCDS